MTSPVPQNSPVISTATPKSPTSGALVREQEATFLPGTASPYSKNLSVAPVFVGIDAPDAADPASLFYSTLNQPEFNLP